MSFRMPHDVERVILVANRPVHLLDFVDIVPPEQELASTCHRGDDPVRTPTRRYAELFSTGFELEMAINPTVEITPDIVVNRLECGNELFGIVEYLVLDAVIDAQHGPEFLVEGHEIVAALDTIWELVVRSIDRLVRMGECGHQVGEDGCLGCRVVVDVPVIVLVLVFQGPDVQLVQQLHGFALFMCTHWLPRDEEMLLVLFDELEHFSLVHAEIPVY